MYEMWVIPFPGFVRYIIGVAHVALFVDVLPGGRMRYGVA